MEAFGVERAASQRGKLSQALELVGADSPIAGDLQQQLDALQPITELPAFDQIENSQEFKDLSISDKMTAVNGYVDAALELHGTEDAKSVVDFGESVKRDYQNRELAKLVSAKAPPADSEASKGILKEAFDDAESLLFTPPDSAKSARIGGWEPRHPEITEAIVAFERENKARVGSDPIEVKLGDGINITGRQVPHPTRDLFEFTLPDGKKVLRESPDFNEAAKEAVAGNLESFPDTGADYGAMLAQGLAEDFVIKPLQGAAFAAGSLAVRAIQAPSVLAAGSVGRATGSYEETMRPFVEFDRESQKAVFENTRMESLNQIVDNLAKVDPRSTAEAFTGDADIGRQAARAVGQGAGSIGAALATGSAAGPALLLGNFFSEGDIAAEDAVNSGSPEMAASAMVRTGAVNASLETVSDLFFTRGFSKVFSRSLDGVKPGASSLIKARFEDAAKAALQGAATEGATEGAQQVAANQVAREFYDENRDIFEGVEDSVAIGALTGAILGGSPNTALAGAQMLKSAKDSGARILRPDPQAEAELNELFGIAPQAAPPAASEPQIAPVQGPEIAIGGEEVNSPDTPSAEQPLTSLNMGDPETFVPSEMDPTLSDAGPDPVQTAPETDQFSDQPASAASAPSVTQEAAPPVVSPVATIAPQEAEIAPSVDSFESPGMESLNLAAISQNNPNRIQPDPLTGTVKPNREVLFDVAKSIGLNIQYKGHARRSIGTYFPGNSKVAIRYEGDLDTAAHEIAHALDDRFGTVAAWAAPRTRSPFDAELKPFADNTSRKTDTLQRRRAEGVAEWVRAWLVNPDEATKAAPKFAAHFEKTVPLATRNDLRAFGDDIRVFAGARAAEQILANVRYRPDSKIEKLRTLLRGGRKSGFEITFWDRVQKHVTDRLRPFEKAVKFAREESGTSDLLPKDDPILMARLLAGVNGVVEDVFDNGMIDAERNRVTPGGIKWLLEPFGGKPAEAMEADMRDAIALMIAERTVEMAGRFERNDILTGIGAGVRTDLAVAEQAITELRADPARYAMLQEAGNRYRQWANANLNYLLEKGRISQEAYDAITSQNQQYVALQRLIEIEPGVEMENVNFGNGGNLGSVAQPIRKLRGSTKTIENPYSSLIEATHRAIKEADRNEVLTNFTDLLISARAMYGQDQNDLGTIGSKTTSDDPMKQAVYRNGKQEYWRFDKDIQDTIKGFSELTSLPALARIPAQVLRFGITNMPQFAIRNVIRDTQSRWRVSRAGFERSLLETFKRNGPMALSDLKKYGGDQAGFYARDRVDYMRALDTAVRELANDPNTILLSPKKLAKLAKRGGQGYRDLLAMSEQFNRIKEYKASFKKAKQELGYDDYNASLYAAAQARDLIDFAVAGETVRVINQVVPFFNAAVQGLRRTVRAGMEKPGDFAVRWLIGTVMPTVLFRGLVHAMGDDEEYEQLPDYLRDMFWNFKVADDLWLRIPKDFEMGALASAADRVISSAIAGEWQFDGYGGSIRRAFLPVDEAILGGPLKTAISTSSNYDFFRKDTIVSPFEKDVDLNATNAEGVRIRKTDRASRLGKGIQALAEFAGLSETGMGRKGFDARVVDFVFRDVGGIAGDTLTRLSNSFRQDTNAKLGLRDVGLFTTSPAWAAKDVQEAFDLATRRGINSQSKTFDNLNEALDAYFKAKTRAERDELAEKVREQGTATLEAVQKIDAERRAQAESQ